MNKACSNEPGKNTAIGECDPNLNAGRSLKVELPISPELAKTLKSFNGKPGAIEKKRRTVRVTNYLSKKEKYIIAQLRAAGIRPMNGIMDGNIPVKYYEVDDKGLWYGVREFYPVRIIKSSPLKAV